ncbi:MAG: hypothetical protein RL417_2288 [Pseudomonadota bacterium]|jgi:uncharacterized protein (DUF2267 family)
MHYAEFIKKVRTLAHLGSEEEARQATQATLETLAERIQGGEALHIASQLPHELHEYLECPPEKMGQKLSLQKFFERVAFRQGKEVGEVVSSTRAVLEMVKEGLQPGELEDLYAQLPDDFKRLFDAGLGAGAAQSGR